MLSNIMDFYEAIFEFCQDVLVACAAHYKIFFLISMFCMVIATCSNKGKKK